MKKIKRVLDWKKMLPLEVMMGIILIAASFVVATRIDMSKAEKKLVNTIDYMKNQCNDSQIRDMASEGKSLLRVTESIEQIRWRLEYDLETQKEDRLSDSILKSYVEDSYLAGLILLDSDGNITDGYDSTDFGCDAIMNMVDTSAIMDTLDFKEKRYAIRKYGSIFIPFSSLSILNK